MKPKTDNGIQVRLPYKWKPRNYQLPAYRYIVPPGEGKRAVCVWHRRAGKDLFAINVTTLKAGTQRVGTYWHVLPEYKQAKNIVWNGFTRDGRRFLDHIPPPLIKKKHEHDLRIELANGSIYQLVGSDNIDSLVGTNPVGVVFSEYSIQNPRAWNYIRPILAENGGWALFIYTPRGRNHGWELREMARQNPEWFYEELGAGDYGTRREDGTPVVSDALIQKERDAGMPEEMIQQEFYVSFDASLVGAYYAEQMRLATAENRLGKVPYDAGLLVETAWDLGIGDQTAIWFFQTYGHEVRVIDYYEASGKGLEHYAGVLSKKPYEYGTHYAPWDAQHRVQGVRIETVEQIAAKLGIRFRVVPKHRVEDRISATRAMLSSCFFDEEKCQLGIDALKSYRKEWDDKKNHFKDQPYHDWSSHGADAFGLYAVGRRQRAKLANSKLPRKSQTTITI